MDLPFITHKLIPFKNAILGRVFTLRNGSSKSCDSEYQFEKPGIPGQYSILKKIGHEAHIKIAPKCIYQNFSIGKLPQVNCSKNYNMLRVVL